jgi:hypothetical protein
MLICAVTVPATGSTVGIAVAGIGVAVARGVKVGYKVAVMIPSVGEEESETFDTSMLHALIKPKSNSKNSKLKGTVYFFIIISSRILMQLIVFCVKTIFAFFSGLSL